jgi:HlyD family secretion protein
VQYRVGTPLKAPVIDRSGHSPFVSTLPLTHLPWFLGMLLTLAGCDQGPGVATLSPERGVIRESFSEPARTRLAQTYPITMPLDGRIGRINLEPGDAVEKGQVLADFDRTPVEEAVNEARAAVAELEQQVVLNEYDEIERSLRVELEATVEAARGALKASDAQVEAQQAHVNQADKEYQRIKQLAKKGAASQQQLDDTTLVAETSVIALREKELLRAALYTLFTAVKLGPQYIDEWLGRKRIEREVIMHQLTQARAKRTLAEHDIELAAIRSPIKGVVLARDQQGGGPLLAGTRLLLIGNLEALEVVADVLTQNALKLKVGSAVALTAATLGEPPIHGTVRRIEPAGFTKLSSLGVEQQRVRVIVNLRTRPDNLGVGYRLQARFYTGEKHNALILPRFSVLQAPDQSFYVFKVVDGRLQRQTVRLGLRNDLQLEILDGLTAKDTVVATPDTTMMVGDKVRVLSSDGA